MIRRFVSPTEEIAKINVTPIIDVALVLVIILLITAPMMVLSDLDLTLPRAKSQVFGDEQRLNVTLGRDGEVAIDETVVSRGEFLSELEARLAARAGEPTLVVIRADAAAPHARVRDLIQASRNAGAERLAIATRAGEREPS